MSCLILSSVWKSKAPLSQREYAIMHALNMWFVVSPSWKHIEHMEGNSYPLLVILSRVKSLLLITKNKKVATFDLWCEIQTFLQTGDLKCLRFRRLLVSLFYTEVSMYLFSHLRMSFPGLVYKGFWSRVRSNSWEFPSHSTGHFIKLFHDLSNDWLLLGFSSQNW